MFRGSGSFVEIEAKGKTGAEATEIVPILIQYFIDKPLSECGQFCITQTKGTWIVGQAMTY